MYCPSCKHPSKIRVRRTLDFGFYVERRRKCLDCEFTCTTYEASEAHLSISIEEAKNLARSLSFSISTSDRLNRRLAKLLRASNLSGVVSDVTDLFAHELLGLNMQIENAESEMGKLRKQLTVTIREFILELENLLVE